MRETEDKMMPQQYCLRWKHHHSNVQNMFAQLLEKDPLKMPKGVVRGMYKYIFDTCPHHAEVSIPYVTGCKPNAACKNTNWFPHDVFLHRSEHVHREETKRFCDVTLYCSPSFASQVPNKDTVEPQSIRGVSLRAHRVVLAACSELLGALLGAHEAHGEPVLVLDGAEPKHLRALLDYMYTGEMNVHHSQLASLLKTAEELRIKGLTDIRWNNKDEPPDCASGAVATTTVPKPDKPETPKESEKKQETKHKPPEAKKQPDMKKQIDVKKLIDVKKQLEAKLMQKSPDRTLTVPNLQVSEPRTLKDDEKFNVNGGPPPLIKLPLPKTMSTPKREHSDSDSPSPKRQRLVSATENTDEEANCIPKTERDSENWHHGNMDISASRVDVGWGSNSVGSSDEEWADAPTDIGSFLHTRLRVDGDNSADEESNDSSPNQPPSSRPASEGSIGPNPTPPLKDAYAQLTHKRDFNIVTIGPKSGPTDPRFTDVIKLHDYLQHGRRPQFWEEHYVKRVMEAVRLKELEMKQAAEILGVSYGTLYGRYRDVYGCINRPYRAVRDFWQVKGPSEVLERLQRGEITLDTAANALGVSVPNLAAHIADFPPPAHESSEFEPIPIEVDPSLRPRTQAAAAPLRKLTPTDKPSLVKIAPKVVKCLNLNASDDDDAIPASIISTDAKASSPPSGGKWPSIRVASIDSLRSEPPPASPSQLMRTRPDLTIVAKKPDAKDEDT